MLKSINELDFIFVGPSKTASTWIFQILNEHHEVSVPPAKDIYYFDKFYLKGPEMVSQSVSD